MSVGDHVINIYIYDEIRAISIQGGPESALIIVFNITLISIEQYYLGFT